MVRSFSCAKWFRHEHPYLGVLFKKISSLVSCSYSRTVLFAGESTCFCMRTRLGSEEHAGR
jgi:hypothetical protein